MDELQRYQDLGFNPKKKFFKRYKNAGLLENLDESYIGEVQEYWGKHYGQSIEPSLNMAFYNLTGKDGRKVVPGTIMWNEVIPFFNDLTITPGYKDKNIYDILIRTPRSVVDVLKCVRKHYFDSSNNQLDESRAKEKLLNYDSLIIKPSNSNNGVGIAKLMIINGQLILNDQVVTMKDLVEAYNYNFIVQEIIEQHSIMAAPHPSSVNTLRMVTLRWKGKIHYLLTFARFGANSDVKDNAGSGGVCLGVTENGKFLDLAIDENAVTHTHHPTTNFCFADLGEVPNFEKFKEFVITSHKDLIHLDFVSWDIAVGIDGLPTFIEANFAGATWLYQLAAQQPLFGELTEEVLNYIIKEKERTSISNKKVIKEKEREIRRKDRIIKRKDNEIINLEEEITANNKSNAVLKKELNESKKKNVQLNKLLETHKEQLSQAKDSYKKLKNSKTFRYTQPIRTLYSKARMKSK